MQQNRRFRAKRGYERYVSTKQVGDEPRQQVGPVEMAQLCDDSFIHGGSAGEP